MWPVTPTSSSGELEWRRHQCNAWQSVRAQHNDGGRRNNLEHSGCSETAADAAFAPCDRCGCATLCWCSSCKELGCTTSSPHELCCDSSSSQNGSDEAKCRRCGCSAEFDAHGDRICWCDSCKAHGCAVTNKSPFQVTVHRVNGDAYEMTASSNWSFKQFLRALAEEVDIPAHQMRVLHGSELDVVDLRRFEEICSKGCAEARPIEVTVVHDETANEDVDSDSSFSEHSSSSSFFDERDHYGGWSDGGWSDDGCRGYYGGWSDDSYY